MTLSRCFTYKTFHPAINDFDKEVKSFRKEVDKKTTRIINALRLLVRACIVLCGLCIFGAIGFAACADGGIAWCIPCSIGCIVLLIVVICGGCHADAKADALEEEFCEENFVKEGQECEKYNAEQEQIALEWRQVHPFEEKIRMAKVRGSSVDIAEMIRHYEEYIKNKN